jgi:Ulp1 family protease
LSQLEKDQIDFLRNFFSGINPIVKEDVIVMPEESQVKTPERKKKAKGESPETPSKKKMKTKSNPLSDGEDICHKYITPQAMRPTRSRRCKKNDSELFQTEDEAIQEAINRSLKNVDPNAVHENFNNPPKISVDKHANVDKTVELFRYWIPEHEIIVRMEDYLCLERNEYLSDVIIDFYLQYIFNELMTSEQREKTYIFPCHFYSLYATASDFKGWKTDENVGLSAREKRYMRIQGLYDPNVNIFQKDFLVFPLLDHNHWFLAIVCYPSLNGSVTIDEGTRVEEADAYWEKARANDPTYKPPRLKTSCILIFDSVRGNIARRTAARTHIKNFLFTEWENKYQEMCEASKKSFLGNFPNVCDLCYFEQQNIFI